GPERPTHLPRVGARGRESFADPESAMGRLYQHRGRSVGRLHILVRRELSEERRDVFHDAHRLVRGAGVQMIMRWGVLAVCLPALPIRAASCDDLAKLALPHTSIVTAESRKEWPVTIRNASAPKQPFCRVAAVLKPSSDSEIQVEVWMPESGWNGKYEAVGNGGWSGSINFAAMAAAMSAGHATSSTDTGHQGSSASFALGHPEKLIDYAYRSEHEMTVAAKA